MKKVRYLAAAAGLAPAAAGLMTPIAGHATTITQAARSSTPAKTVSLRTTNADTGCVGTIFANIPPNGNVKGGFWYTNYGIFNSFTCIGTVRISAYYGKYACHYMTATVAGGKYRTSKEICGSGWVTGYRGVHISLYRPFDVCVGADNVPGYACRPAP